MMEVVPVADPDLGPVTLYTVERTGRLVAAHCGLCEWSALAPDHPHLTARAHLGAVHALYFEQEARPCPRPTSATTTAAR